MKIQGPYANRKECRKCIANVNGRCKALISTTWIRGTCPFRKEKDGETINQSKNTIRNL